MKYNHPPETPRAAQSKEPLNSATQRMASTTPEELKVSVITRSGAGEQHQPSTEAEVVQDKDIEVKEEPLTRQQPKSVHTPGRSMALGGYIAPTIDWTQDSQLPDRLEDFKRECLTLFGLELKDADDNAKALRMIQWAGEPGKRQFKAWNIKARDLKIAKVWEEFEKFAERTKNFMRARFDLMKMQQRKDEPADVWYQ